MIVICIIYIYIFLLILTCTGLVQPGIVVASFEI